MNGNSEINMDKLRFMLDTNVIIDTLNNDLDLLAFLETFPDCEIYINPVVAIEVLAKAGMSKDEEADALIAASAIVLNAIVLSNDSHLRDYKHSGYSARAPR